MTVKLREPEMDAEDTITTSVSSLYSPHSPTTVVGITEEFTTQPIKSVDE